MDLAVTSVNSRVAGVLRGRGDGTFLSAPTLPVGNAPFALVTTDLNGDGLEDVVTANRDANSVSANRAHGSVGVMLNSCRP